MNTLTTQMAAESHCAQVQHTIESLSEQPAQVTFEQALGEPLEPRSYLKEVFGYELDEKLIQIGCPEMVFSTTDSNSEVPLIWTSFKETNMAADIDNFSSETTLWAKLTQDADFYSLAQLHFSEVEDDSSSAVSTEKFQTAFDSPGEKIGRRMTSCDEPTSVTAPKLEDQTYTITDYEKQYMFPAFTTDPLGCNIDYKFQTDASGVVAYFDSELRTFRFLYKDDLLYCGDTEKVYEVTVSGSSGKLTPKGVSATFNLTVKNPCGNPDLVIVESVPLPEIIGYTPYSPPEVVNHEAYTIRTTPVSHTLCGSITYEATWTGGPGLLTTQTSPVKYDATKQRFTIYSENALNEGEYTISMKAYITVKPENQAPAQTIKLKIYNACEIAEVKAPPQPVRNQFYSYESPEKPALVVEFGTNALNTWTVSPATCPISFRCVSISLRFKGILSCNFTRGQTEGTFDTATGKMTFKSRDIDTFQTGSLIYQIFGEVGSTSILKLIKVQLRDPCPTASLEMAPTNPFLSPTVYQLRSQPKVAQYTLSSLATLDSLVDCGAFRMDFTSLDGSSIDQAIFLDNRSAIPSLFGVIGTEDVDLVGKYEFTLTITLKDYPGNSVTLAEPYVVQIVDPCDQPSSISAPLKLDGSLIRYSLTAPAITFRFASFTQVPSWCAIKYSYALGSPLIEPLLTSFDEQNRSFTFEYTDENLIPLEEDADTEYRDFDIALKGRHGNSRPVQALVFLKLRVYNPCFPSSGIEPRPTYCPVLSVVEENYIPKMPDWLAKLTDFYVPTGASERIELSLGKKVNHFNLESIEVDVDMRLASEFSFYDHINHVIVINKVLTDQDLGYFRLNFIALDTVSNKTYTYEKHIYLIVYKEQTIPVPGPDDKVSDPEKITLLSKYRIQREKQTENSPQPQVLGLDSTGLLKIGWNRVMLPASNAQEVINGATIKVKAQLEETQRRSLQALAQSEEEYDRLVTVDLTQEELDDLKSLYLELQAIDISLFDEYGDLRDLSAQPGWTLQSFDSKELHLQVSFPDVAAIETGDTISIIFWDPQFFKDTDGHLVAFGAEVHWDVGRQVPGNHINRLRDLSTLSYMILGIGFSFLLVLVMSCGPLLPIWMFVNSMQLILHVPLIEGNLPGTSNWFMLEYLNIIRLHVGALNDWLHRYVADTTLEEARLAQSEDDAVFYTTLVHSCGYSFSLWPNLVLVIALLAVIFAFWILSLLLDLIKVYLCGRRRTAEPWMTNLTVRFLYEVFFEIALCVMINVSHSWKVDNLLYRVGWEVSIALIALMVGLLILICLTTWSQGGPKLSGVFEKATLSRLFWGHRPLRPDQVKAWNRILTKHSKPAKNFQEKGLVEDSTPSGDEEDLRAKKRSSKLRANVPKKFSRGQRSEVESGADTPRAMAPACSDLRISEEDSDEDSVKSKPEARKDSLQDVRFADRDRLGDSLQPQADPQSEVMPQHNNNNNQGRGSTPSLVAVRRLSDEFRTHKEKATPAGEEYEGGELEIEPPNSQRRLIEDDQDDSSFTEDYSEISLSKSQKPKIDRVAIMAKMEAEAHVRVHLESTVYVSRRYQTLFYGLRKNHPNNAAVVHPLFFLLRRIVYASIVLFMVQLPLMAIYSLCCVCLAMLAYVCVEHQWEDGMIACQHILNEIALYLILMATLMCSVTTDSAASTLFGWSIVALVIVTLIFNVVVVGVASFKHCKRKMRKNRKKYIPYRRQRAIRRMKKNRNSALRRRKSSKLESDQDSQTLQTQGQNLQNEIATEDTPLEKNLQTKKAQRATGELLLEDSLTMKQSVKEVSQRSSPNSEPQIDLEMGQVGRLSPSKSQHMVKISNMDSSLNKIPIKLPKNYAMTPQSQLNPDQNDTREVLSTHGNFTGNTKQTLFSPIDNTQLEPAPPTIEEESPPTQRANSILEKDDMQVQSKDVDDADRQSLRLVTQSVEQSQKNGSNNHNHQRTQTIETIETPVIELTPKKELNKSTKDLPAQESQPQEASQTDQNQPPQPKITKPRPESVKAVITEPIFEAQALQSPLQNEKSSQNEEIEQDYYTLSPQNRDIAVVARATFTSQQKVATATLGGGQAPGGGSAPASEDSGCMEPQYDRSRFNEQEDHGLEQHQTAQKGNNATEGQNVIQIATGSPEENSRIEARNLQALKSAEKKEEKDAEKSPTMREQGREESQVMTELEQRLDTQKSPRYATEDEEGMPPECKPIQAMVQKRSLFAAVEGSANVIKRMSVGSTPSSSMITSRNVTPEMMMLQGPLPVGEWKVKADKSEETSKILCQNMAQDKSVEGEGAPEQESRDLALSQKSSSSPKHEDADGKSEVDQHGAPEVEIKSESIPIQEIQTSTQPVFVTQESQLQIKVGQDDSNAQILEAEELLSENRSLEEPLQVVEQKQQVDQVAAKPPSSPLVSDQEDKNPIQIEDNIKEEVQESQDQQVIAIEQSNRPENRDYEQDSKIVEAEPAQLAVLSRQTSNVSSKKPIHEQVNEEQPCEESQRYEQELLDDSIAQRVAHGSPIRDLEPLKTQAIVEQAGQPNPRLSQDNLKVCTQTYSKASLPQKEPMIRDSFQSSSCGSSVSQRVIEPTQKALQQSVKHDRMGSEVTQRLSQVQLHASGPLEIQSVLAGETSLDQETIILGTQQQSLRILEDEASLHLQKQQRQQDSEQIIISNTDQSIEASQEGEEEVALPKLEFQPSLEDLGDDDEHENEGQADEILSSDSQSQKSEQIEEVEVAKVIERNPVSQLQVIVEASSDPIQAKQEEQNQVPASAHSTRKASYKKASANRRKPSFSLRKTGKKKLAGNKTGQRKDLIASTSIEKIAAQYAQQPPEETDKMQKPFKKKRRQSKKDVTQIMAQDEVSPSDALLNRYTVQEALGSEVQNFPRQARALPMQISRDISQPNLHPSRKLTAINIRQAAMMELAKQRHGTKEFTDCEDFNRLVMAQQQQRGLFDMRKVSQPDSFTTTEERQASVLQKHAVSPQYAVKDSSRNLGYNLSTVRGSRAHDLSPMSMANMRDAHSQSRSLAVDPMALASDQISQGRLPKHSSQDQRWSQNSSHVSVPRLPCMMKKHQSAAIHSTDSQILPALTNQNASFQSDSELPKLPETTMTNRGRQIRHTVTLMESIESRWLNEMKERIQRNMQESVIGTKQVSKSISHNNLRQLKSSLLERPELSPYQQQQLLQQAQPGLSKQQKDSNLLEGVLQLQGSINALNSRFRDKVQDQMLPSRTPNSLTKLLSPLTARDKDPQPLSSSRQNLEDPVQVKLPSIDTNSHHQEPTVEFVSPRNEQRSQASSKAHEIDHMGNSVSSRQNYYFDQLAQNVGSFSSMAALPTAQRDSLAYLQHAALHSSGAQTTSRRLLGQDSARTRSSGEQLPEIIENEPTYTVSSFANGKDWRGERGALTGRALSRQQQGAKPTLKTKGSLQMRSIKETEDGIYDGHRFFVNNRRNESTKKLIHENYAPGMGQ